MPNFPSIYLELQELWKKIRGLETTSAEIADKLQCVNHTDDPSSSTVISCDLRVSGSGNPNVYIGPDATDSDEYSYHELLIVGKQNDAYLSVTDTEARTVLGSTNGIGFVGSQTDSNFTIRQENDPVITIKKSSGDDRLVTVSGSVEITGSLNNGLNCVSSGDYSHAEGGGSVSAGNLSHAEGMDTLASGQYSHTEGGFTTASVLASYSHAEGYHTIAIRSAQHVQGLYNQTSSTALMLVGNGIGTSSADRSNILEVYQDSVVISGNLNFPNGNGIDFGNVSGSGQSSTLLDDYEQGTWTPIINADTHSILMYDPYVTEYSYGYYTKIGKVVFYNGTFKLSGSNPGLSGPIYINSLPYSVYTSNYNYPAGTISYVENLINPKTWLTTEVNHTNNRIYVFASSGSFTSHNTKLTNADINTGSFVLTFAGQYITS